MNETKYEMRVDALSLLGPSTVLDAAYGFMSLLFSFCFYYLWIAISRFGLHMVSLYLAYISVMFLAGTTYLIISTYTVYMAFIVHPNYPAGSSAYIHTEPFSTPIGIARTTAFAITSLLADGLMLWRLIIFYSHARYGKWIVAGACTLYSGVLVTGVATVVETSLPGRSIYSGAATDVGLSYWVLSVIHTILATLLIVSRVLIVRWRTKDLLGESQSALYVSVATMMVESSSLYSATVLTFLVAYVLHHPAQYIMIHLLSQVQKIAPFLIIFRVARGRAWQATTSGALVSTFSASPQRSEEASRGPTAYPIGLGIVTPSARGQLGQLKCSASSELSSD